MTLTPAPLPRRLMASILDGFYAVLLAAIPAVALAVTVSSSDEAALLATGTMVLVVFLYDVGWIAYRGATPGKRQLGLVVVDSQGAPLGLGGAFVRTIVKQGAGLLPGIGLIVDVVPGLVSEKRRCLHDLLSGSIVVDHQASTADGPARAAPAPYPVRSEPTDP